MLLIVTLGGTYSGHWDKDLINLFKCCVRNYAFVMLVTLCKHMFCLAGCNFKSIGGGSFIHRSNSGSQECK
jgi:hypothetical protein